jgi:hypothetical protein
MYSKEMSPEEDMVINVLQPSDNVAKEGLQPEHGNVRLIDIACLLTRANIDRDTENSRSKRCISQLLLGTSHSRPGTKFKE